MKNYTQTREELAAMIGYRFADQLLKADDPTVELIAKSIDELAAALTALGGQGEKRQPTTFHANEEIGEWIPNPFLKEDFNKPSKFPEFKFVEEDK